jgi:hypothetical protein
VKTSGRYVSGRFQAKRIPPLREENAPKVGLKSRF